MSVLAASVITLGTMFLFFGALGIFRMPDVYNRMQAGTKATTLGTMLTLLGVGLVQPEWIGQMLILIIFVVLTNPISSHALARAAHFAGYPLTKITAVDKLKAEEDSKEENREEAE
ncbi:MAG: Na+/H+ antiporter subunit G [Chlorobi bacterium]|nr:Na+/H+ antiporter subunit G [Chlorobiota bacterium]